MILSWIFNILCPIFAAGIMRKLAGNSLIFLTYTFDGITRKGRRKGGSAKGGEGKGLNVK